MEYDVFLGGKKTGCVQVTNEGLYYRFQCRCMPPGDGLYRLHIICGDNRINLGVCIPDKEGYILEKCVPQKKVGKGEMAFLLVPENTEKARLHTIHADEQFTHIPSLMHARLAIIRGEYYAEFSGDPE